MKGLRITFLASMWLLNSCWSDGEVHSIALLPSPVVWKLSEQPILEIGVLEGDEIYELHAATSSVRLTDGSIVVANTGTQELRAFGPEGRHLWTAGGRGGGPGEFRWLKRVYSLGGDSVAAYDVAGDRFSTFDRLGTFAEVHSVERATDPDFPLDVWLHAQTWVEGAMEQDRRLQVRRVLDMLPPPTGNPAYRIAHIDSETNIWIREPQPHDAASIAWSVFDTEADHVARIETPVRFDIHELGSDFVLGRWRGDDDVNFIRMFRLERTEDPANVVPQDLAQANLDEGASQAPRPDLESGLTQDMADAMRNLVIAQERYFAGNGRYSTDRFGLEWEGPEGLGMDIISAASVGWTAVFTHSATRTICGVFVGWDGPPGWTGEAIPKCRPSQPRALQL